MSLRSEAEQAARLARFDSPGSLNPSYVVADAVLAVAADHIEHFGRAMLSVHTDEDDPLRLVAQGWVDAGKKIRQDLPATAPSAQDEAAKGTDLRADGSAGQE